MFIGGLIILSVILMSFGIMCLLRARDEALLQLRIHRALTYRCENSSCTPLPSVRFRGR